MYLPTMNHINLSFIHNFPLPSLSPSVNLLRLDISHLSCLDKLDGLDGLGGLVICQLASARYMSFERF